MQRQGNGTWTLPILKKNSKWDSKLLNLNKKMKKLVRKFRYENANSKGCSSKLKKVKSSLPTSTKWLTRLPRKNKRSCWSKLRLKAKWKLSSTYVSVWIMILRCNKNLTRVQPKRLKICVTVSSNSMNKYSSSKAKLFRKKSKTIELFYFKRTHQTS